MLQMFLFIFFSANVLASDVERINIRLDHEPVNTIDQSFYSSQLAPFTNFPDLEIVSRLNLGFIRVGGNLYDSYNWKNETSYLGGRVYKKLIPIEEQIKFIKKVGAEPIIQINMMGMMPEKVFRYFRMFYTADSQNAAGFLKHLNDKQHTVTHFCMGNEFAQWMDTHNEIWPFSQPLSADEYIKKYVEYVIALRDAQEEISGDPNDIKIWGPEISISYNDWQTGNMVEDCQWTDVYSVIKCSYGDGQFTHFLPYFYSRINELEKDRNVNPKRYKLLDYASFHYYPNFRTDLNDMSSVVKDEYGNQLVEEILESVEILDNDNFENIYDRSSLKNTVPKIILRMKQWLSQYYPSAKLAFSEYALDSYDKSNFYDPVIRPLYMADVIGKSASSGVDVLIRAFLSTNSPYPLPWAILKDNELTDIGELFLTFVENFSNQILNVENKNKGLGAYASTDKNLNVILVNRRNKQRNIVINYILKGKNEQLKVILPPFTVSFINSVNPKSPKDNISITEYSIRR